MDDKRVDTITAREAKPGLLLNSTPINAVLTEVGTEEEIINACAIIPFIPNKETKANAITGPPIKRTKAFLHVEDKTLFLP
jgi:hypothetical protein